MTHNTLSSLGIVGEGRDNRCVVGQGTLDGADGAGCNVLNGVYLHEGVGGEPELLKGDDAIGCCCCFYCLRDNEKEASDGEQLLHGLHL